MAQHEYGDPGEPPSAHAHGVLAHLTTPEERRRAFTVLFFSLMCLGAGQSVMFAILPSLARQLGLTEFEASLPFVASATIWVFTSGYWGTRSDHRGRKPIILLGLIAFGVSFASFAIVASLGIAKFLPVVLVYPLMIFARALYGMFGSGTAPAAQAYVADRTTREERTSGVATIGAAFEARHHHRPGHWGSPRRVRTIRAVLFHRTRRFRECHGDLVSPS